MHSASSRRSDRTPKAAAVAAPMKRTQGRQKIQMELIRDPNALQVCFSKRRKGLVKKVFELCVLCDAQVALVVFSPAGKPYSFAHPSFPAVVDRFLSPSAPAPAADVVHGTDQARLSELQREAERLAEAVHEAKEVRGKELEAKVRAAGVWVDGDLSRYGTPQLEAALAALLGVQAESAERAHEILAQEAMMQQQHHQQYTSADGTGSHGDLFDYLGTGGSYTAAEYGTGGHGGDLFDYLGSGGSYYAPDAMAGTHGHAHEPAMDAAIDLMWNNAGSLFHYLGSTSAGSFMADGGGGGNHGEVGAVDTNIRLMGGCINHTLVPMMPPPLPPLLCLSTMALTTITLASTTKAILAMTMAVAASME